MNSDEKLILTAWSRGLAGAGARLAKRSWWVLQDSQRRPPGEMVGAWANASEAQAWILNFHTMGVVGLFVELHPNLTQDLHRILTHPI